MIIMKKLSKNSGILVISAIIFVSVFFSVLNLVVYGYGLTIDRIEINKSELHSGDISTIDIWLRNNEPEAVGVVVIHSQLYSTNNDLEILNDEITIKSIPKKSFSNPISIQIQANQNVTDQNHEVVISLILNENEVDKKIINLQTVS